jgi:tetratricopeptide (TPR) repeat protein
MFAFLGRLLNRKPQGIQPATASAIVATASSNATSFAQLLAQASAAAAVQDHARALEALDAAISLDGTHAEAHYQRGNTLKKLGRLDRALASYTLAIDLKPDHAHAYCNRGVVQQALCLTADALASYEHAIALDPRDALAHYNRALLMQELDQWDEAVASYDRAIAVKPDYAEAQYNRALALLFLGEFDDGWRGYEWRWKLALRLRIGTMRDFPQPLWLGDFPIAGRRLLLHAEAGLGDTLQFCRYATACAARGATVILEVQSPLRALLANLEGVAHSIAAGDPLPPFDLHCSLMSLPLAFKTTLDTIPCTARYLHADPSTLARWRAKLGTRSRPRVGLVWSGNPENTIDPRRSIRLADLIPHLPRDLEYFSLQKQLRDADRATLATCPDIVPFDEAVMEFTDTAALCVCLDVIVSVDTSVAHLCGALGLRTWVLLPTMPDWRWMRAREDTPWYPTMTLYRQTAAGDWSGVLARVAADLRREFGIAAERTVDDLSTIK